MQTKWRWILALALLLPATAFSQSRAGPTALSAAATTTCAAPLNTAFLTLVVQPATGAVVFNIGANASGNTVSFFVSGGQDASGNPIWIALNVTAPNSTSTVTTSTAANTPYRASVSGYSAVCAEISTLVSGTTTVTINLAPQSTGNGGATGGGGGGGGGGVTSVSGDGSLVTNVASTGAVTLTLGGNTQYGVLTGGGAGTAPVALAPPTTAAQNGVNYILTQSPSSGAAAAAAWTLPGVPIDARTTTTEAVAATDRGEVVTLSNAGAIALSLIQAGTSWATNNLNFGACAIGAGAVTLTPATSTINGASTLVIPANRCAYVYSDNTNYFASEAAYGNNLSGSSALSAITAAVGSNTISNGNNPQIWNWAQTTNTQYGFVFGETSAATSGTFPNQGELKISTAAGSTAIPLNVFDSLTGSQTLPALYIAPTWNTSGVATALLMNVTNTGSGAASKLFDFQVGGTSQVNGDKAGNLTVLGTVSAGTTPCTGITLGTGGGSCANEGTAPTGMPASTDTIYADSTALCNDVIHVSSTPTTYNQGCLVSTPANPAKITVTASQTIGATSLCATTVCNAGLYQISIQVNITTACTTTGTLIPWVGWTDDQGAKGAVGTTFFTTAGGTGFVASTGTLTTTSTSDFMQGTYIVRSTGAAAINYGYTSSACGSGSLAANMYLTVTRLGN